MAVRQFVGIGDAIHIPIPASGGANVTGAFTIVDLIKRDTISSWQSWMNYVSSAGALLMEDAFDQSTNTLGASIGGTYNALSTPAITATTTWHIIAVTKAAGSATPRAHVFPLGGSWTHADFGG